MRFDLIFYSQLVNRKKAAKKKSPTPLTADMLNELNKNHMGGLENYGAEDLYNLEDTWDERRQDLKPKAKVPTIIMFVNRIKLISFLSSASQRPHMVAIQIFTIAGDRSISNAIKPMSIITTRTIPSTNFNQSTSHSRVETESSTAARSDSGRSRVGRIAPIRLIMETVVTIIVLGD